MKFVNGVSLTTECENCCPLWKCVMQSEEYNELGVEKSETTHFLDQNSGVGVGSSTLTHDLDTSDAVTTAGLEGFLSRPVRIANFAWNESDPVGVLGTYSPWHLFFDNASIKYKLNNFAFIRADLKIKIVVNASPFYYGSLRACYQPLPAMKGSTILPSTVFQPNSELIPYSQQPGVWIKPQHSEGAEMTLPFFYNRSFLRVGQAQDFTDMGTLRMVVYNALQSANGVTGTGISVQVFAWAENVHLAGPTVGLSMQADEYGVGVVSGPASTVARVAGLLTKVPVIGRFATATQMGASAVAGIAKLFGWTNVPVISDTQPYRPTPFPQLASTEIGFPVEKLTLDCKNELTVDPKALGLDLGDELAIQNFATRDSFVVSVPWSTSTAVDTPLFTSKVSPQFRIGVSGTGNYWQFTPMGLLTTLFANWRGDIIFTFRFIASPYHKGRVRISYDPVNNGVQTLADTGAVVFNQIVDLSEETEVEIRVPYQQALAWCYTQDPNIMGVQYSTSPTPSILVNDTIDNGVISVKVLTALSAPAATSSVNMQIFVRGAENLEFANPHFNGNYYSPFAMQSEESLEVLREQHTSDKVDVGRAPQSISLNRGKLYMGEHVRSLRPLLRRAYFSDAIVPTSNTTNLGYWRLSQYRYPLAPGFDPNGFSTGKGITVPTTTYRVNFCLNTPFHIIQNCFIAQRGAMHWYYNWEGPTDVTIKATRLFRTGPISNMTYVGSAVGTSSANIKAISTNTVNTADGGALTNQTTQAGLCVSVPNYSAFKFHSTSQSNGSLPQDATSGGEAYSQIAIDICSNGAVDDLSRGRLERYFSVGTDYNVFFFLNCPTLCQYNPGMITPA